MINPNSTYQGEDKGACDSWSKPKKPSIFLIGLVIGLIIGMILWIL